MPGVSASSRPDRAGLAARLAGSPPWDSRLTAGTRLILAASGLLLVYYIPSEPNRWAGLTYATLLLYALFAAAIYVLEILDAPVLGVLRDWGHWIDVAWYTILIALSSGTNSIFFYGYFFTILVASFRWGFASGMRVTLVSVLLFTTLGYATAPPPPDFETQRFLIRPVFLLALGYMVASRGGLELKMREQLRFLKEVSTVSNPRFGVDRTIGVLMHRLLRLHDADGCGLITRDSGTRTHTLRRVRRETSEGAVAAETIPDDLAALLLPFPDGIAAAWSGPRRSRTWSLGAGEQDGAGARPAAGPEACEALAATLEAGSFITVPFRLRDQVSGRLYLSFRKRRAFDEQDAAFLVQVMEQTIPLIENIHLVDQLASASAREERRRIARDIHDSVIQPYVGLRIGLVGLREKFLAEDRDAGRSLQSLIEMTGASIEDLRRQVSVLRGTEAPEGGLLQAVTRFARSFSEATGIAVEVRAESDVRVNDRVAGEVVQMVAEGLSNIRRHTQAVHALVRLACLDGHLTVQIENAGPQSEPPVPFMPRSITERAQALGGRVDVARRDDGGAAVRVEIPL